MRFFGIGFLILVFFEIMSIVWVADWLGGSVTLLLMIVSFIAGVLMLRHIGFSTALLAGATLRSRENVSLYQMLWPIRYALAAVCLLSPGFVSTVLAAGLMLPIKGKPVADLNAGSFEVYREARERQNRRSEQEGEVIEGEYRVTDDNEEKPAQKQIDYIDHKP